MTSLFMGVEAVWYGVWTFRPPNLNSTTDLSTMGLDSRERGEAKNAALLLLFLILPKGFSFNGIHVGGVPGL